MARLLENQASSLSTTNSIALTTAAPLRTSPSSPQPRDVVPMEMHVAGLDHGEMWSGQLVKGRQQIKRHAGKGMVLGMIGHVPGKLAHQPRGHGRAAVL